MVRTDLHEIPVWQWTAAEMRAHLAVTFDRAAKDYPDLLEPYMTRLEGLDEAEQVAIMRQGLRETFTTRHPNPFAKPADESSERSD